MEKRGNFFSQLKTVASDIEKQLDEAKKKYENRDDVCVPAILTSMYGVNKDVKQIKEEVKAALEESKQHVNYLDNILSNGKALIGKLSQELKEQENYMQQYGYIPFDSKEDNQEVKDKEVENDPEKDTDSGLWSESGTDTTNVSQPKTPVNARVMSTNVNRTPQMEDFGISQATMDMIKAMEKKQPVKHTTQQGNDSIQKLEEVSITKTDKTFCVRPGSAFQQPVPDYFQHDGLILTPSVFGREIDRSVLNIHEALASPVSQSLDIRDFQEFDASSTTKHLKDLPAFPNLGSFSEIKENVSPKEPELLSQNTSHALDEQKLKEPRGKRSLFDDDLPQSPKLYANYGS